MLSYVVPHDHRLSPQLTFHNISFKEFKSSHYMIRDNNAIIIDKVNRFYSTSRYCNVGYSYIHTWCEFSLISLVQEAN